MNKSYIPSRKVSYEPLPKSLDNSRAYSPEGKAKKPDNRNWAIRSKHERMYGGKVWASKYDQQRMSAFKTMNGI